eukprot:scaffold122_cov236-Pinguiococcus_pyrenoidosus.AAC.9
MLLTEHQLPSLRRMTFEATFRRRSPADDCASHGGTRSRNVESALFPRHFRFAARRAERPLCAIPSLATRAQSSEAVVQGRRRGNCCAVVSSDQGNFAMTCASLDRVRRASSFRCSSTTAPRSCGEQGLLEASNWASEACSRHAHGKL